MKLYDLEIDLSSNNGGLPTTAFKDWMRVKLHGHAVERALSIPIVCGAAYFHNAGGEDVTLRRGAAIPIRIGRGEWALVMFDGSPNGMARV